MTGEAPWMGVTPQPPSDSEPDRRVIGVVQRSGAHWTDEIVRAILDKMLRELVVGSEEEGLPDPHTQVLRIHIETEEPWPDQPGSH